MSTYFCNFSYPFQVKNGKLLTTSDYPEIVGEAILSAIQTKLEERVMTPEYGTDSYVFYNGSSVLTNILADIRRSIDLGIQYYSEVSYQLYGQFSDNGQLIVDVHYQVGENAYEVTLNV